jgi:hypothetical protein
MNEATLEHPVDLLIDQLPDERGNVVMAATFERGRMIALEFNAN